MAAIAGSLKETVLKLMADQQNNSGVEFERIMKDQETKMFGMLQERELADSKQRNELLLGFSKIAQAAEAANNKPEMSTGAGGKPRKGKRSVRKVGDGVWEMVEQLAEEVIPAETIPIRRAVKGDDGNINIEELANG